MKRFTMALLSAIGLGIVSIIGISISVLGIFNGIYYLGISLWASVILLFWGVPMMLQPPFGYSWRDLD